MPGDNWQHRSEGMLCRTCMWFQPKVASEGEIIRVGRCRRRAPTMNGWPVMHPTDWCGDHKLDETKIPPTQLVVDGPGEFDPSLPGSIRRVSKPGGI